VAQPSAVLDASALLAWLHLEPGALAVRAALNEKAAMSVVNWAEVLMKLADLGQDPVEVRSKMLKEGIFEKDLLLWPLDEALAVEVAKLGEKTRWSGLSLGDRACISLGPALAAPGPYRRPRLEDPATWCSSPTYPLEQLHRDRFPLAAPGYYFAAAQAGLQFLHVDINHGRDV